MTARINPELAAAAMRAAGVKPLVPYPGAREKWLCRCLTCGSEVTPQYANVKAGHGGCWPCAQAERRRVPEADAVAAMNAVGLLPLEPYPGSHSPWLCKCITCGRTSKPWYKTVVGRGASCTPCAIERRGREGRVDETLAISTMRNTDMEPLTPYPGAGEPWPCQCTVCGTPGTPRYNSVRMGHAGCRPCQHRLTAGASQRLTHEAAAEVMVKRGLEPREPYPGSKKPWRCQCLRCGAEVTPTYSNILSGWGGCRTCSPGGFDATQKAVLYLISHPRLGAAKVGIGNALGRRLKDHAAQGWETITVVRLPGPVAEAIEASILDWWRDDLGLPPYLSTHEMPQGGWTETVDLDAINVADTIHQIDKIALSVPVEGN
jgi:hypothetical protein